MSLVTTTHEQQLAMKAMKQKANEERLTKELEDLKTHCVKMEQEREWLVDKCEAMAKTVEYLERDFAIQMESGSRIARLEAVNTKLLKVVRSHERTIAGWESELDKFMNSEDE